MRRYAGLVVAAVLPLACSGCGIPTANTAQPLSNLGTTATTPTTLAPGSVHVFVYFLKDNRLIRETANVSPSNQYQLIDQALVLLGYGPTAPEARSGVISELSPKPQATNSLQGPIERGVATVVLDPSFVGLFGTQLVDALGQIVFTVTANSSVATKVLFYLQGQPFDAFLPDSAFTPMPVGESDFAEIAPR